MPPGAGHEERSAFLFSTLKEFEPEIILVSSSKHTYALSTALRLAADRVVYLVHNHEALPFDMLRRARAVVAVSSYSREYLRTTPASKRFASGFRSTARARIRTSDVSIGDPSR